jgi:hypothetical protein
MPPGSIVTGSNAVTAGLERAGFLPTGIESALAWSGS